MRSNNDPGVVTNLYLNTHCFLQSWSTMDISMPSLTSTSGSWDSASFCKLAHGLTCQKNELKKQAPGLTNVK